MSECRSTETARDGINKGSFKSIRLDCVRDLHFWGLKSWTKDLGLDLCLCSSDFSIAYPVKRISQERGDNINSINQPLWIGCWIVVFQA